MKKIISIFLIFIMTFSFSACSDNGEHSEKPIVNTNIDLINNGVSEYKIVIPAKPTEDEIIASDELQIFFNQSTGVVLDIVYDNAIINSLNEKYLAIGNTTLKQLAKVDVSGLPNHGFKLVTKEKTVIMAGVDDKATVYAVYEFLTRQLGYEYYNGDEIYIDTVSSAKLLNFDVTDAPQLANYWVGYPSADRLYRSWYRFRTFNTYNIYRWPHSHFSFISPGEFSELHHDWFNSAKTALCLTNTEMMDKMAERIIEFVQTDDNIKNIQMGAEDSWAKCTCDKCVASDEAYTHTGTDLIFINYVSNKLNIWLNENQPGRKVQLVALNYFNTESPPVIYDKATDSYKPIDPKVVPLDSVAVHICFISADYSASFVDPKRNSKQVYNLKGWKALTNNLTAYLYNGFFVNEGLVFFDDFAYKSEYYKILKEYGFEFVNVEGSPTKVCTFEAMRTYVTAKLLWNSDLNVNDLTTDFISNYYKAASPFIQEYYDKISLHMSETKAMYEADNKNFGAHVQFEMNKYLRDAKTWPESTLRQYLDLFKQAYKAIDEAGYDDILRDKMIYRVQMEEISPRYLLLLIYKDSFSKDEYVKLVDEFNTDSALLGSKIRLEK